MIRFSVTKKFIALLIAGAVTPLLFIGSGYAVWVLVIFDAVLCGVTFLDYFITPGADAFEICRMTENTLRFKAKNEIVVAVKNNSGKKISMELKDDIPSPHFEIIDEDMAKAAPAGEETEFSYTVVPAKRGSFAFGGIHARYAGALGLCVKYFTAKLPVEMKVYPDLTDVGRHRILLRKNRILEAGIRPLPARGAGAEFESLRGYVSGDDYRKINWTATARENSPVVNEYEAEKNQPVYMMVDTGRPMSYSVRGNKKLDHAILAALTLSDIVNLRGDNSGLIVFGTAVKSAVPPGKGPEHRRALAETLYDIEDTKETSDYENAFRELIKMQKRRGLVFIFTDFETQIEAEDLARELPILKKRHTPVVVLMENESVKKLYAAGANDMSGAYRRGLAAEYLENRRELIKKINRAGVFCIQTDAERFATEAVNRYIAICSSRRI